jgi:lysophospholipase L1-like esterase
MNPIGRRQSTRGRLAWPAVVLSVLFLAPTVFTQTRRASSAREHWVGTWATAVVARVAPGQGQAAAAPAAQPGAQGQAGQGAGGQGRAGGGQAQGQNAQAGQGRGDGRGQGAPQPPLNFNNQTIRQIIHTSIGGSRVRVVLSNAFGTQPLPIDGAHLALRDKDSATRPGTDRTLMFSGSWTANIPAGGVLFSDPVDLKVPAMSDLAVDIQLAFDTATWPSPLTIHNAALTTSYVSPTGNFLGAPTLSPQTTTQNWFLVSRVDVLAPASVSTLVALGDSITDGTASTRDTNNRWPDHLVRRLASEPGGPKVSVLNLGIAGNRVLRDGAGVNALARLERDVLVQPAVKWVVFMEGINDVGLARQDPQPKPEEIIAGHKQVIARAHERGLKIYGGTLTPFEGVTFANYFSEQGEATRQAVNQWIRTSKAYDGVIDFDALLRDSANPRKLRADIEAPDHLHMNDAGYKLMGDAVYQVVFKGAAPALTTTTRSAPEGQKETSRAASR